MQYCTACGKRVDEAWSFCQNCGTGLAIPGGESFDATLTPAGAAEPVEELSEQSAPSSIRDEPRFEVGLKGTLGVIPYVAFYFAAFGFWIFVAKQHYAQLLAPPSKLDMWNPPPSKDVISEFVWARCGIQLLIASIAAAIVGSWAKRWQFRYSYSLCWSVTATSVAISFVGLAILQMYVEFPFWLYMPLAFGLVAGTLKYRFNRAI